MMSNDDDEGIMIQKQVICEPEFEIAKACAKNNRDSLLIHLHELLTVCDTLSDIYRREKGDNVLHFQQAFLKNSTLFQNGASFRVWVLVARLLLRSVTMGVGVATVMGALPRAAATFYALQHDLKAVAHDPSDTAATIRCGTPFAPMTCDAMRSPYLLKWIFSREDMLQRPLTPIDGRLYIVDEARWYVPANSRPPMNRRLIDLEKEKQTKTRQKHFDMLRLFKKSKLIDSAYAKGLLIHYTISIEDDEGEVLLLIRDTSDAIDAGIELVTNNEEEELPQARDQSTILLESLIVAPDATARIDRFTLRAAVATSRTVPRRRMAPIVAPPPPIIAPAARRRRANVESSTRVLRPPVAKSIQEKKQPKNINNEDKKGIIVQTKYDGDRMQGHVDADGKVTLFTRRGVDVTTLYSTVAEALKKSTLGNVPCIVDGELIVIDSTSPAHPLPWSNEKWRHNNHEEGSVSIEAFYSQPEIEAEKNVVMMLEYNDTALARAWDAADTEDISFATQSGLRYFLIIIII